MIRCSAVFRLLKDTYQCQLEESHKGDHRHHNNSRTITWQQEKPKASCVHCYMFTVDDDDEDGHCTNCGKSQVACSGCGEYSAETCIECDEPWCTSCWEHQVHRENCLPKTMPDSIAHDDSRFTVGPTSHEVFVETNLDAKRPGWDEYFMKVAYATAERSTCPRRAVGAVIVQEGRIIATGYNGAPAGAPHCPTVDSEGHPSCMKHGHCVRTVHAEMNAIISCASAGVRASGAVLYTTAYPCPACMASIINAGLSEVCFHGDYSRMSESAKLAAQVGLNVTRVRA